MDNFFNFNNMEFNTNNDEKQEVVTDNVFSDVLFIVLLVKSEKFGVRAPYDLEILGKKMWEWVAMCGEGAKIKTTPCMETSDILTLIKPFVGAEKYTFVLYSDTPLLSKVNCMEILDYFKARDLNVLKLKRGMVFNSQYLLNCENIMMAENKMFDGEEFEKVDNFEKLNNVTQKLKNVILDYHISNGVQILDRQSTYIDADVVIEKGVKIAPNNYIKGNTYIGEYCELEPNNTIKDSEILSRVIVKNSYISNSRIPENMIVGPFEAVLDKKF